MTAVLKITSIIAHIDHGKTTLMDSLIASQGHISRSLAGDLRYMDSRPDEQARNITLKLGPMQLANGHVFIDTPGHVDFESLIFCSSILSENFMILVDVNEGITPRTYSLVKYLNKDRAILVLNKVDKLENAEQLQHIVHQMNALVGDEIFAWEKNNVVLCCASLCCGLSQQTFRFGKKNTLKAAFSAFLLLNQKYDNDNIAEIMEKYKIKFKTKKNVFSTVMPLHAAVFDAIDTIYTKQSAMQSPSIVSGSSRFILSGSMFSIEASRRPDALGISVYGMFRDKGVYTIDNVMFITRIFHGRLKCGMTVHSITGSERKETEIKGLYVFSADRLVPVEEVVGPSLVCLQGAFLKNAVISTEILDFSLPEFMTPFYMAKVVLSDPKQLPGIKEAIRALYFTEQCLKVKKNKFNELEVRCSGVVQFEKICSDLASAGFEFAVREPKREFGEYPGKSIQSRYSDDSIEFTLQLARATEDCDIVGDSCYHTICAKNGNVFHIKGEEGVHIIESVLEMFIEVGPLIRENILGARITVDLVRGGGAKTYNTVRNELSALYMESQPKISPRLFSLRISLMKEYLGAVYTLLEKFHSIIDEELYDDDTGFFVLVCRIAQFSFAKANEEICIKTKGTAYVEARESEYSLDGDFSAFVDAVREEKGLYIDKMIVENPDKQRTHRK